MGKFLLLLLLLEVFPTVFFQGLAPPTLCMVCKTFEKGRCVKDYGNCTMHQGPGCRTRDFFIFTDRDGWFYNHTELDCSHTCFPSKMYFGSLKILAFCCQGQDFCNRYQGRLLKMKVH